MTKGSTVRNLAILSFACLSLVACNMNFGEAPAPAPAQAAGSRDSEAREAASDSENPPPDLEELDDDGLDDIDSPACNDLANIAVPVEVHAVAAPPPAPEGGTLVDGTYVVTASTLYTGEGGASGATGDEVRMTVRIRGAQADSVFDGVNRSAVLTVDGTRVHSASTCPSKASDAVGFTSTGEGFALFLTRSEGTLVQTFSKR
jgi:hypothetical protein